LTGLENVIAARRSPDSPRKDLAEMSAIFDSVRIEPRVFCTLRARTNARSHE
jgi:hypothetical protein